MQFFVLKKSEERRKSSKKCARDDKAFLSLANLIMCTLHVPKCKNVCLSMWKEKGKEERGECKAGQLAGSTGRERERRGGGGGVGWRNGKKL